MSGRRVFVPRTSLARNIAVVLASCTAMAAAPESAPAAAPRTFARAYEPGEIVRFAVDSDEGTSSVRGEFLGKPVSFAKEGSAAETRTWIGWGVIPLDAKAQAADYSITEKLADGSARVAHGSITIAGKSFPEQRLTVESKFVNPPKAESARIEREQKRLAAIYARRSAGPPAASPFVKPVDGDPTSEFGTRRFFNDEPRSPHPGIDLRAATGTPVLCSGPGRIALAADLYYSGGTVIVDHGGGLFTIYAHLSKIEAKEGAKIAAGDRVGLSGATGRVTGPHLHWGARVGSEIFDPRALLDPRLFGSTP